MIKAYKSKCNNTFSENDDYEIRIINLETGAFEHYCQDEKIGFIYSHYNTTVFDMGYTSVKECLKTLKERNMLGEEVDYKEQRNSEKLGYLQLGVERIKRAQRVCTTDFEDVCNKLSKYGLGFVDAQNQIIGLYEYQLEEA